jgi:pimeloyl-ACP methyl ester carboxylesterase
MREQDQPIVQGDSTRRRFLTGASAVAAIGLLAEPPGSLARAANAKEVAHDYVDIPVNVGDVILGARTTGSGETIVILPSLARGALDFDPLARLLAVGGYRVISIDPRGIGGSWTSVSVLQHSTLQTYADDTVALISQLRLKKVHLLGHAAGNRIARVVATQHPEIIQTLILCAAGGGTPSPKALAGLQTVTNPNATAAEIRQTTKEVFFAPQSDPRPWYLGWYPVPGAQELTSGIGVDFSKFEGGANKPMLIIQGKSDIVAPPKIGHELRAKYGPRITVHDIAGAGHAMIIEKTAEVATLILRFLTKHRIRH